MYVCMSLFEDNSARIIQNLKSMGLHSTPASVLTSAPTGVAQICRGRCMVMNRATAAVLIFDRKVPVVLSNCVHEGESAENVFPQA